MKFNLKFIGRRNGAIGILYRVSIIVEADNIESAALKAYDTHEHIDRGIDGIEIIPVPNDTSVSIDDRRPVWDIR